jgi:alpha-tubulin suppressor-like RCC1 family protein
VEPPAFSSVAAGDSHALFLTPTGDVWTCGYNGQGQLARDNVVTGSPTVINLGKAGGLAGIAKIVATRGCSYFLTTSGVPYTCGDNSYGGLGRVAATGTAAATNVGAVALSNIVDMAAANGFALFLTSSGTVYSCGYNNYGSLGRNVAQGSATVSNLGVISGLPVITAVATSFISSYFLTSSGTVYSCGYNTGGALGRVIANGSAAATNLGQIPGLSGIVAIFAGGTCAFFLAGNGDLYSCGINDYGTLGGTAQSGHPTVSNLGLNTSLSNVTAVASGGEGTTVFMTASGKAYSCGWEFHGLLGRATTEGARSLSNLGQIPGLSNIVSAALAMDTAYFVSSSGEAWSCGQNSSGQLGHVSDAKTNEPRLSLGAVPDLTVSDVKYYDTTLLYVKTTGDEWYSCGYNYDGRLGRVAPSGDAYAPGLVRIVSPLSIRAAYNDFFLTTSGDVYSFGNNSNGRLGRAVETGSEYQSNLGQVAGLSNVTDIFGLGTAFFRTSSGTLYSCGNNTYGQLGRVVATGTSDTSNLGQVTGVSNVKEVYPTSLHTFIVTSSGTVYSCGHNGYCALGRNVAHGSVATSNLAQISSLSGVTDIKFSNPNNNDTAVFFRTSSGTVYSCGYNQYGVLGRAVASGASAGTSGSNLAAVPSVSNVTSVVASRITAHFLTSAGVVYNCGNNAYGQLGRIASSSSETSSANLGTVSGLPAVQQVVSTGMVTYFLTNSGEVYSCGYNGGGQLGRDTSSGSTTVSNLGKITALPTITSISTNENSMFFLAASGDVYSCGSNTYGQLGRAVASGSVTFQNLGKIDGLPPVSKIVTTIYATYFITTSGELWSCGHNIYGVLGRSGASGVKPINSLGRVLLAA